MKPNLKTKSVEKSVRLSVTRPAGVPVTIVASLIPRSCHLNEYIEAIETLRLAYGLSDFYADNLIKSVEAEQESEATNG